MGELDDEHTCVLSFHALAAKPQGSERPEVMKNLYNEFQPLPPLLGRVRQQSHCRETSIHEHRRPELTGKPPNSNPSPVSDFRSNL